MANTVLWNDPDTQQVIGNNSQVEATYLIDPVTKKAVTPGGNGADVVLIASGAFTSTQTVADQTNTGARGILVILDVTVPGTGSITLEIDAKDPASGKYIALLTGAAVVTLTTVAYRVYPGLTPAANATVSDVLPHTWRVKVTSNNANSITYSVGASLLV